MERAIRQSKKAGENVVQMSGKVGVVVAAVATTATAESKLAPFNPNSECFNLNYNFYNSNYKTPLFPLQIGQIISIMQIVGQN